LSLIYATANRLFGVPVNGCTILELLAAGMTYDELLKDYAGLHLEDIYACLEYASYQETNIM
jgi:uncharacterized protein (DUF433 family)